MFRAIRRTLTPLALLFVATPGAGAQDRLIEPECGGTRMCVRAPCPQPPPCPVGGEAVVRTGREVRVTLEGRVLRYEVTERWTNRGHTIGEADYVLPLPRNAAFEDLALEIDGEMVTGEALDANRARAVYEEIVRKKKDPALVEWMGLGLFRTRIFPIQPGETRTVVVRFRAVAEREGDALRVDVPAPRGSGTAGSGTSLSLRWPAGDGFGEVWSPTHRVDVARDGVRRTARVEDATGTVTLLVPVRSNGNAAIAVLTHAPNNNEGYALITLTPPAASTRPARRLARRDLRARRLGFDERWQARAGEGRGPAAAQLALALRPVPPDRLLERRGGLPRRLVAGDECHACLGAALARRAPRDRRHEHRRRAGTGARGRTSRRRAWR